MTQTAIFVTVSINYAKSFKNFRDINDHVFFLILSNEILSSSVLNFDGRKGFQSLLKYCR